MQFSDNTLRKMKSLTSQLHDFDDKVELKRMVDLNMMHSKGGDAYMVITDGARRGTIGKAVDLRYHKAGGNIHFNHTFGIDVPGKGVVQVGSGEVSWLKGYAGPGQWIFTRKEKDPAVKLIDKAGTELSVGDTVVVADDDTLYLGRLDRRTDKGTIWVKEIKMRADEIMMDEPVKIMNVFPDRVLKLDGALMDKIVLAKLTN